MSFNEDFLTRQADPNDVGTILLRQGTAIKQVSQAFVHMKALDEITGDMGDQRAGRFISSETGGEPSSADFSGVFLSGALQAIADGNLARFAEVLNGIAQFWVANGAAWAGRGAVKLDEDGINLPEAGDAITMRSTAVQPNHAFFSFRSRGDSDVGTLEIATYRLADEDTRISNGDFETGDLTNWTESDPGGDISVVETDKGYSLLIDASGSGYIQQDLSATASEGIVVKIKAKADGTNVGVIKCGNSTNDDAGYAQIYPSTEWRNFIFAVRESCTNMRLTCTAGNGALYVDEIEVQELDGLGGGLPPYQSIFLNIFGLSIYDNLYINGDVNAAGDFRRDGSIVKSVSLLPTHGLNASVPISSTRYLGFMDVVSGLQTTVYNFTVSVACTARNLVINTNSTQPASGNQVFTVLKNTSTVTDITKTVNANDPAGQYSDLVHSVELAAGDSITLRAVNNATGAVGATIVRCSLELAIPLTT